MTTQTFAGRDQRLERLAARRRLTALAYVGIAYLGMLAAILMWAFMR